MISEERLNKIQIRENGEGLVDIEKFDLKRKGMRDGQVKLFKEERIKCII